MLDYLDPTSKKLAIVAFVGLGIAFLIAVFGV